MNQNFWDVADVAADWVDVADVADWADVAADWADVADVADPLLLFSLNRTNHTNHTYFRILMRKDRRASHNAQ